ncbi:hypothetical protein SAY87_023165 [Trapa incisa]|uniref:Uncharacterized protein n=1 Tax=Trapa incisa TaxID=236973 RepID=A0AAN7K7Q1_9MYRT|nr:hypothetical protein SAY87_023165 [Trapa incisa]
MYVKTTERHRGHFSMPNGWRARKVRRFHSLFESSKSPSRLPTESAPQYPSRLKNTKLIDLSRGGDNSSIGLQGIDDRIVMYFTSLRGIPQTYQDCYAVRMIFRGAAERAAEHCGW